MAIARLSQENAVDIVAKGLTYLLEPELRAKLKPFRDQLVKEIDDTLEAACKAAAENVVAHVQQFNNFDKLGPELHIHFGFKEKP